MLKALTAASAIFAMTLVWSPQAQAVPRYWFGTVKFVYPQSDGSFVLGFTTDSPNCTSGFTPNKYYYVQAGAAGVTADGVKAMLGTSLLALGMQTTMSIIFDDATSQCFVLKLSVPA